jgi:hypothetical protein
MNNYDKHINEIGVMSFYGTSIVPEEFNIVIGPVVLIKREFESKQAFFSKRPVDGKLLRSATLYTRVYEITKLGLSIDKESLDKMYAGNCKPFLIEVVYKDGSVDKFIGYKLTVIGEVDGAFKFARIIFREYKGLVDIYDKHISR